MTIQEAISLFDYGKYKEAFEGFADIYNKSNERLAVQIEGLENKTPTGLVFIAHGMSGYKEHHLVRIPTEICLNKGYR